MRRAIVLGAAWLGVLGACGDDVESATAPVEAGAPAAEAGAIDAPPDAPTPKKLACEELPSLALPESVIGLPTSGATVSPAHVVTPDAGGAPYCLAEASIAPVDPTAPPISLHVALPQTWNGKAMLLGGGGFDGTIPDVTGTALNMPPSAATPLAAGYAVFASDGGHSSSAPPALAGLDATFMTNAEAYRNWVGDAPKKTHDVAMQVILATYGTLPTRSYVIGSSTGGRETLAAVSRFPADWDGAVALYPARNVTVGVMGMTAVMHALAQPGAFPNAAKRKALWDAVLATCDMQDGVADGVVSNITACNAAFDPVSLRCAGGVDTGDTCLSDAQITALHAINAPVTLGFTAASGETDFAGYNIYAAANGVGTTSPLETGVELVDLGAAPPGYPFSVTSGMAYGAGFSDGFVRFGLSNGADVNYLTFDMSTAAPRLNELSKLDIADFDLSGFAAKGGKLLILQGTADLLISPRETERYVATVQAKVGDSFFRYYEVPGLQHEFSTTFYAVWDQVAAIEGWVEKGVDPAETQIVTDLGGVPGRTRPLCLYPKYPKYSGTGDVNLATSFTCATP